MPVTLALALCVLPDYVCVFTALSREPHITRKMVAITWAFLYTFLWFVADTHVHHTSLMCTHTVYMQRKENTFSPPLCYCEERERKIRGLARVLRLSEREKKSLRNPESEGKRQWKGKGTKEGEKCGVKGTFLMTTHNISEGHESHNTLQAVVNSLFHVSETAWQSLVHRWTFDKLCTCHKKW